jgi:ribosomal protein L17
MRISNEILNYIGNFKELLSIVRDGKIQSFQVKSKARTKLIERYRSMAKEEKIAANKSTGGEILHHLWTDAFVDEKVFLKMLRARKEIPESLRQFTGI